jgi:hypothetical protein
LVRFEGWALVFFKRYIKGYLYEILGALPSCFLRIVVQVECLVPLISHNPHIPKWPSSLACTPSSLACTLSSLACTPSSLACTPSSLACTHSSLSVCSRCLLSSLLLSSAFAYQAPPHSLVSQQLSSLAGGPCRSHSMRTMEKLGVVRTNPTLFAYVWLCCCVVLTCGLQPPHLFVSVSK